MLKRAGYGAGGLRSVHQMPAGARRGEPHNCLGGGAWDDECQRGLMRVYAVSRTDEGAPGSYFSVRIKDGLARVSETGARDAARWR